MPLEIGDEKLFAIYKIKESELNDSCVMRQINPNELNHKGELWYRREGGTAIEYKALRPGLDIEFWWPYDEKNKQISTKDKKVGRFRKCKVISAKAVSDEPTEVPAGSNVNTKNSNEENDEEIKQLLLSELDVSPKFFESPNWKDHLNSCLDLLLEDDESDPEEKELQNLRKRRSELAEEYKTKKARLSRTIAHANSLGL